MGTLSYSPPNFYFLSQSQREETDAKSHGLFFDENTHTWKTRSFKKAQSLRRYADHSAENELKKHFITELTPPESISYPDHLAPRSWQIESAWHALTRTPSYIADEAGLGKTITAILAMNSDPGKALIICPPYLKYNWVNEITLWRTFQPYMFLVTPELVKYYQEKTYTPFIANTFIVPDSILTNPQVRELLIKQAPFKWLVIDEFQRFKNEKAKRTQAVFEISRLSQRSILLSGTPIPNGKPIELYPSLSRLAPESIGHRDVVEFGKTFCAGKRITRYEGAKAIPQWDFSGASNLKRLRCGLKNKLMIRHLKKDHLKELGPKSRRLIFLDAPTEIFNYEEKHLKNFKLEELLGKKAGLGSVAEYRKKVGQAKIKDALEYIQDILENSKDKLIVAAHHIEVVETLFASLKKYSPLKIRGGMSAKEKSEAVNSFQKDSTFRVIVGNIQAMGLGVTLTKAFRGIMVEYDWAPSVNEQMEDRLHRISQENHVMWDYLVLRGSLDERMLRLVLEKEININEVMS